SDVAVRFEFDAVRAEDAPPISRQYPKTVFDLFEGEQLVVVGRYAKTGAAKVVISGKTGNEAKSFDFPAEFSAHSSDSSFAFVEKLWATRRIGEIIDQLDLHGKNEELTKELVELSTKHGILTPYTSFLADETARPQSLALSDSFRRANEDLSKLGEAAGRGGFAQRAEKSQFQNSITAPAASRPSGGNSFRDLESDREVVTNAVRSAGKDALYARGVEQNGQRLKLLVTPETAQLDLEKNKEQITEIERYSDEYFAIVNANSVDENLLFVQQSADEQLLVKLRGKTYLVK
ncbi:MAG: hypothetical protein B7Z55_01520, partial [Planctomycetales bacterium 12-60-4]